MQEDKKLYTGFAIGKGFVRLREIDQPKAKDEIMELLRHKTSQAFGMVCRGEKPLTDRVVDTIELIFAKYGVIEVWGLNDKEEVEPWHKRQSEGVA